MGKIETKKGVLMLAGVVVIAGILLYASHRPPAPASGPSTVGVPVYAPKGELTPGFPKALILDSAAVLGTSYSINYSATTNQYTAAWNSSSSIDSLYNTYKTYLPANGWTIVNENTKYPAARGLYAQNASSDVSVAIWAQSKDSQIIVTYLVK